MARRTTPPSSRPTQPVTVAPVLGGGAGSFTSGGTESCLLAVLAARETTGRDEIVALLRRSR